MATPRTNVSFYSGQLEPVVPSPFERAMAYGLDMLISVFGVGILTVVLAGGWSAEALGGFLVGHAVYYAGPTIVFGGTPAKLLSGLRVRMIDGSRISPDAAILRYLVFALTVFYVPFGALITGVFLYSSPERLAVHDRIGKTIVMYKDQR